MTTNIAFIGLGEAATALISGWDGRLDAQITAYDIKHDVPETRKEITSRAAELGITCCDNIGQALGGATLVFSTVTADQAIAVAQAGAPHLVQGAVWCDLNSCAPSSKHKAAAKIDAADGRYLDVAVMAPVYPRQNMVPCLLSGPYAEEAALLLADLPMNVRCVGDQVGQASSIKMIRSVMVKGMEALTAECTLAAVAAGVEDEVISSLSKGQWSLDVAARASYNFERCLHHGARRASEMDEVAATLADLGLPNSMAVETAAWQRRIAQSGVAPPSNDAALDYHEIATQLLPLIRRS
jgi:3-hydroxyisobutyrate dehydrogenase-like beta-hydroxyacid dehydrogenase